MLTQYVLRSFEPQTGDVDTRTNSKLQANSISAMGYFDMVALVFTTYTIALSMVGELKDIELVSIAVHQAAENISFGWRIAFTMLNGIRRWVVLPALLLCVPILVRFISGA
eukprot:COSAG06_NODE_6718_length_2811_cov_3.835546_3_plen_111_part_00